MIVSNLIHMALALLLYFALNFSCICIDYTLANGFKPTWKALMTGQYRNCIARAWDLGGIYLFVAVLVACNALASSCNWASTGTQWVTPCTHGLCATACAFLWREAVINGTTQHALSSVMSVISQAIAIKQQLACWASFVAWSALA
jgi:hypothetical protein